MDKKKCIESIISDLEKLTRLVEIIQEQENVPKLDLDLALDKVRQLYDNLLSLSVQEPQVIAKQIIEPTKIAEKKIEIKAETKEVPLPVVEAIKEEEPEIEEEEQAFEFDLTEESIDNITSMEPEEEKEEELDEIEEIEEVSVMIPEPEPEIEPEPEAEPEPEPEIIEIKEEPKIEEGNTEIVSEKIEIPLPKQPVEVIPEKEVKTIEPTLFGEVVVKPIEKKPVEKINKQTAAQPKNYEPKKEGTTVAEQLQNDTKTLNDTMATKSKDISTVIQIKPIANIKAAIGLNDRFQFINELFLGDADLYNKTIDKLNGMANLDEALAYINENFEWDIENETFKKFLDLIYRRFPMIIE